MNAPSFIEGFVCHFLNGVCRHERDLIQHPSGEKFLNGVCRHEL